jgi:hypothetical protein
MDGAGVTGVRDVEGTQDLRGGSVALAAAHIAPPAPHVDFTQERYAFASVLPCYEGTAAV